MLRILLIDGERRAAHYAHLRAHYDADWLVPSGRIQHDAEGDVDIALISDEFPPDTWLAARELQRRGVPVLHIVDGIIEWRNCWENPRSDSADRGIPLFQPVVADKIACLGRSQARVLESWGNIGRCEVVGSARLDPFLGRSPRRRRPGEPFRILVATARRPGFTEWQVDCVRRALTDLKAWDGRSVAGERVELCWRLTHELDRATGLTTSPSLLRGDLPDVLAVVDAVVTTPSTLMLEAMLVGLPVALVDYTNSPHYVPAAWTVSAPEHIERVLPDLVVPPPARLLHQGLLLHDALECHTPATPRLVALIETMVEVARACKARHVPVVFPAQLVTADDTSHRAPERCFDLRTLYPGHPIFKESDRAVLQVEITQLRLALKRTQHQLDRHGLGRSVLDKTKRLLARIPALRTAYRIGRRGAGILWAKLDMPRVPSIRRLP